MTAGEQVTASDIDAMIASQQVRELMPGDALLIHTGWEEKWSGDNADPIRTEYYSCGPGLSRDAAQYNEVYLSAIFILPLRVRGAANSAVRPVAIGRPYNVEGPATPRGDLIGHTAPDRASAGSAPERSAPSSSRGR
jgi:kynurenine formamidase